MRLGVMSDTHGNIDRMNSVAKTMTDEFNVDTIVHLGDDLSDTEKLIAPGIKLFAVPGIYEAAWDDDKIQHRIIKELGGVNFLFSHTPTRDKHDKRGDINPEKAKSKYDALVLLHGHTHKHCAFQSSEDGLITINPGHLKDERDRGNPASFAIIDVSPTDLAVKFIGLDGSILDSQNFDLKLTKKRHGDEEESS